MEGRQFFIEKKLEEIVTIPRIRNSITLNQYVNAAMKISIVILAIFEMSKINVFWNHKLIKKNSLMSLNFVTIFITKVMGMFQMRSLIVKEEFNIRPINIGALIIVLLKT